MEKLTDSDKVFNFAHTKTKTWNYNSLLKLKNKLLCYALVPFNPSKRSPVITPLSKAKLKYFRALSDKKKRLEARCIAVEGVKMLEEALQSEWEIVAVVLNEESLIELLPPFSAPVYLAEKQDFQQLNSLSSPEGIITYLALPASVNWALKQGLPAVGDTAYGFILDNIQDPGNVGTILRIADWFGFPTVLCGEGTADAGNPKTLRASMGAVFRLDIRYVRDLHQFISQNLSEVVVADMLGELADKQALAGKKWIVLGNEGKGISPQIRNIAGIQFVSIPRKGGAESLNVGIAAGILAFLLV